MWKKNSIEKTETMKTNQTEMPAMKEMVNQIKTTSESTNRKDYAESTLRVGNKAGKIIQSCMWWGKYILLNVFQTFWKYWLF